MTMLPIALTAAAGAALVNIWLAIGVGRVRVADKVIMGDGGNESLIARMRAHANFVEYTPFVLVLIALIELARGSATWLWAVASVYLIARVLHGLGMSGTFKPGRGIGTIVTMLTLLGLAIVAIYIVMTTPAAASVVAVAAR